MIDEFEDYNHKIENNFDPTILKYSSDFFLQPNEKPLTKFEPISKILK